MFNVVLQEENFVSRIKRQLGMQINVGKAQISSQTQMKLCKLK